MTETDEFSRVFERSSMLRLLAGWESKPFFRFYARFSQRYGFCPHVFLIKNSTFVIFGFTHVYIFDWLSDFGSIIHRETQTRGVIQSLFAPGPRLESLLG